MAFKDHNCTCDRYCRCGVNKPCGCENMLKDPHCENCLQHLSPGAERAWREDFLAHGIDLDKEPWDDGTTTDLA
jgi:hypothetical protein